MADNTVVVPDLAVDSKLETPAYKKLDYEERLEIENSFLKVQNLSMQLDRLKQDVQSCVQMRDQEQKKMDELSKKLSEKYDVDITKTKILPDGTIMPNDAAN